MKIVIVAYYFHWDPGINPNWKIKPGGPTERKMFDWVHEQIRGSGVLKSAILAPLQVVMTQERHCTIGVVYDEFKVFEVRGTKDLDDIRYYGPQPVLVMHVQKMMGYDVLFVFCRIPNLCAPGLITGLLGVPLSEAKERVAPFPKSRIILIDTLTKEVRGETISLTSRDRQQAR